MRFSPALLLSACVLSTVAFAGPARKPTGVSGILMYKDVAPIFAKNCVGCHQGAKAAHHLDLTSYANIMKGDKKKVVVAGNPGASRLATVLHGKPEIMPPAGAMPAANVTKIEAWIKGGAHK